MGANRILRIGDWRLDTGSHRLSRGEDERVLVPKEMAVLLLLADAAPAFLSTDELLERGWPGSIVVSNALHQVIRRLRTALGDSTDDPSYIETLPRLGYRLIARVEELGPTAAATGSAAAPAGPAPAATFHDTAPPAFRPALRRWLWPVAAVLAIGSAVGWWWGRDARETMDARIASVAVLPLRGIGLPAGSEWLTYGISSELVSLLATIPGLEVASQAEAFARSGVPVSRLGRELGVEGVLLGSLNRVEDGLEVRMELVRTRDAGVVWRETFDGSMDDPLAIQRTLASRIFKYFGEANSDYGLIRPRTPQAYIAHLKRLTFTLSGNTAAEREWAEMTVALEPTFAMGHIHTIFPYMYAALNDPYGPWKSKVRHALDEAARLGIGESAAYKAHEGLYQWVFEGDLERAEPLLREAFIAGDWYGRTYYSRLIACAGIHAPLVALYERLTVLEPHQPLHWDMLAEQRAYLGDYRGAVEAKERSLALTGENFMSLEWLVLLHLARGDVAAAQAGLDRQSRLDVPDWRRQAIEALVRARTQPAGFSDQDLAEATSRQPSWATLLLVLARGDADDEQELLDSALAAPQWGRYWVDAVEPMMRPEDRESPRWQSFRRALGYTDEWRAEVCRRMASLPPETGLACDPELHPPSASAPLPGDRSAA